MHAGNEPDQQRANERAVLDRGTPSLAWHLSPSLIDCHLPICLLMASICANLGNVNLFREINAGETQKKNIPASRLGLACQAENGLRYEDDLLWLSWRGAGRNVLWPQRNGFLHLRLPQLPPPASFQTSKIPPLAHPLSPTAFLEGVQGEPFFWPQRTVPPA